MEHSLNAMRVRGARRQVQCDRDDLSPEIGGNGCCSRIAPPGITDQLLAGSGEADKRLHIAWVVVQRGEIPPLGFRCEFRP